MSLLLKLHEVTKYYGNEAAVESVSLTLERGQVLSILGPSGSGKSTLLRLIQGIEQLTAGRIEFFNAGGLREEKRSVGIIFQQFNLFPHLSVLENVTLHSVCIKKMSRRLAVEKAKGLLDTHGVWNLKDRMPNDLSGGEQQRVAIVRALMMDPSLILMDEPTSSLDPERASEVLSSIQKLAHSGIALLVVTHAVPFARKISDQIGFLEKGRLIALGRPSEVLDTEAFPRVKNFVDKMIL